MLKVTLQSLVGVDHLGLYALLSIVCVLNAGLLFSSIGNPLILISTNGLSVDEVSVFPLSCFPPIIVNVTLFTGFAKSLGYLASYVSA